MTSPEGGRPAGSAAGSVTGSTTDSATSSAHPRNGGSRWFLLSLRLGLVVARFVPTRLLIALSRSGWRFWGRWSRARVLVQGNLARIRPGDRSLRAEDVFASYGAYWGEFLALAARPGLADRLDFRVEGEAHLWEASARGPVCLLSAHLGNWDLGACWAARRLANFVVVAEPLRPASLFALFSRVRERWGLRVLSAEGGGVALYRHLRNGGHAALVADRSLGPGAREVPFFGVRRGFPAAGMETAWRAGAALVPAFLVRDQGHYVVRIHPPLSRDRDPALAFAGILEEEIRARPEQWCMLRRLQDC
jgi:lauroyl/myristoyl acyltransferase